MENFNPVAKSNLSLPRPSARRRARVRSRRLGASLLAQLALMLSLSSVVLILLSDPYWLAAPAAIVGMLLGRALRRKNGDPLVCAALAESVGLCALTLWLIVCVVFPYVIQFDFSLLPAASE